MNQITVEKDEVLYCQRTTWILFYHQALCLYMLQATTEAQRVSAILIDVVQGFNGLKLDNGKMYRENNSYLRPR